MKTLDPYSDRLTRDIRNSLSSALVKELTENADGFVSAVADEWLARTAAPIYRTYIEDRVALYRLAIGVVAEDSTEPIVRVAIKGRTEDGWYPLSKVEVVE